VISARPSCLGGSCCRGIWFRSLGGWGPLNPFPRFVHRLDASQLTRSPGWGSRRSSRQLSPGSLVLSGVCRKPGDARSPVRCPVPDVLPVSPWVLGCLLGWGGAVLRVRSEVRQIDSIEKLLTCACGPAVSQTVPFCLPCLGECVRSLTSVSRCILTCRMLLKRLACSVRPRRVLALLSC